MLTSWTIKTDQTIFRRLLIDFDSLEEEGGGAKVNDLEHRRLVTYGGCSRFQRTTLLLLSAQRYQNSFIPYLARRNCGYENQLPIAR